VLGHDGRVNSIACFSRDITERNRAEAALRESEARFKVIASSTPDHLLVQDRDLRYVLVVNPQLGFTEQDMLGKTDHDFLARADADHLTQIKRQVLGDRSPGASRDAPDFPARRTPIFRWVLCPEIRCNWADRWIDRIFQERDGAQTNRGGVAHQRGSASAPCSAG